MESVIVLSPQAHRLSQILVEHGSASAAEWACVLVPRDVAALVRKLRSYGALAEIGVNTDDGAMQYQNLNQNERDGPVIFWF